MSKLLDVLNKPIGKPGPKSEKIPTKTTMNLYVRPKSMDSPVTLVITAILLTVFIIVFTKAAVIDKLDGARAVRKEYSDLISTKIELENELRDYNSIREEYFRYAESYLSDEDSVLVDRVEIVEMLKNVSVNCVEVTSISVSNNKVIVTVKAAELEEVGLYKEKLEQNPLVSSVVIYNAEKTMISNRKYTPPDTNGEDRAENRSTHELEYIEQVTATMMLQVIYPEDED